MMIKITIITICYNAQNEIRKTVESVLEQTYPVIEYLVIDGGSTDATLDILADYSDNPIMKIYSEKDDGIYNAMNRGIARAGGDYILFLNAGDTLYHNEVIKDAVSYMQDVSETIYYGKICKVSKSRPNTIFDFNEQEGSVKSRLLKGSMPCHQAILAPRSALRNHYFREAYKLRADYEWLVYSVSKGIECVSIPIVISNFDDSGISGAVKSMEQMQVETQNILKEYASSFQEEIALENLAFEWKKMSDKHLGMFMLLNCWMKKNREGFELGIFLERKGIHTIAVYGMGYLGENVLRELANSNIEVKYAIDRNAANINAAIEVYSPTDKLEAVDAIIVATVSSFKEIKENLEHRINAPIIALEDIVFNGQVYC